jgi:hypothetical protein
MWQVSKFYLSSRRLISTCPRTVVGNLGGGGVSEILIFEGILYRILAASCMCWPSKGFVIWFEYSTLTLSYMTNHLFTETSGNSKFCVHETLLLNSTHCFPLYQ